jgi:hypothetical protein
MLTFLRNRLNERSTWMLISAGIAAAAPLTAPWSYVAFGVGVIAALVPDGPVKS